MHRLNSFLSGTWSPGEGDGAILVDPSTEAGIATASTRGLDLGGALEWARETGGPALRALSFAERGAALKALSGAIHEHREELIEIGMTNAGNTRGDAKFDIDGATATLAAYAHFAKGLPDGPLLPDGEGLQLGRSPRFHGQHVWAPRRGVAVHINAFNFPAWGMLEKAACAWLAGLPVLEKPATATAMMAERIAHIIVDSGILPEGAFSFMAGSAGDLLDHVHAHDCVAFTGSSGTAQLLRAHAAFVKRGARLNVEADSLNSVVVGPDVDDDSEAFDVFVRDTAREMTQKAGQKCTATRRVIVPEGLADAACEALAVAVQAVKVGAPREDGVRMGPLTNADQLETVQAGLSRLAGATTTVTGGAERLRDPGFFLAPTLLRAAEARTPELHDEEIFGPVSTVMTYSGSVDDAAQIVRLGGGALVASIYSDDRRFPVDLASTLAADCGRLYLSGTRLAEHGTGSGLVLPNCVHGGPGRAGGGEELGGLRGLQFYMQRTAIQGYKSVVEAAFGAR